MGVNQLKLDNMHLELTNRDRVTITSSILIEKVYEDGTILSINSRYVRVFKIVDINYELSDDKSIINKLYQNILNSSDKNVEISIIVDSKKIGKRFIDDKVLFKSSGDSYDELRNAMNEIIKKNSNTATISKDKYLVIAFTENRNTKDYKDRAINRMFLVSNAIVRNFESITNARLLALKRDEVYQLFHRFYNKDRVDEKLFTDSFDMISEKTRDSLSISISELISPSVLEFHKDFIKINSKYAIALHMSEINKNIDTNILDRLCDNNFEVLIGLKERPIDPLMTNVLISREIENVEGEIYSLQGKLSEKKVSIDLVPQSLKIRRDEAININKNIKTKNDGLFDMGLYALIYGDTYEEARDNVYTFMNNAMILGVYFDISENMQENVFNTILPYGINQTVYTRVINSEGLIGFQPFNAMDMMDKNGVYYGKNLITNNPVTYNVDTADNYTMLIFGMTGKGKSAICKMSEIGRMLLDSKRHVIIIDNSDEYRDMVESLGGQNIYIEAGGNDHINLFDIDKNYGDNPLADKEDLIISICGEMLHKKLTAGQRTTVSMAVSAIYKPWVDDETKIPTIEDFEHELEKIANSESGNEEDKELLKAIKYYSKTSYCTLFRGKTNIDSSKRIINYNLKNLGKELRPLAMQVILDNIWLKACKNRYESIPTDIIIDEFHLMFLQEDTASFMAKLWKMLRKYKGCPIGVTQNPEDVLNSFFGRDVIYNTGFIVSLSLQESDIKLLSKEIGLSTKETDYIRNKDFGTGLIYVYSSSGKGTKIVVPFENKIPENNLIYRLIDTRKSKK